MVLRAPRHKWSWKTQDRFSDQNDFMTAEKRRKQFKYRAKDVVMRVTWGRCPLLVCRETFFVIACVNRPSLFPKISVSVLFSDRKFHSTMSSSPFLLKFSSIYRSGGWIAACSVAPFECKYFWNIAEEGPRTQNPRCPMSHFAAKPLKLSHSRSSFMWWL